MRVGSRADTAPSSIVPFVRFFTLFLQKVPHPMDKKSILEFSSLVFPPLAQSPCSPGVIGSESGYRNTTDPLWFLSTMVEDRFPLQKA